MKEELSVSSTAPQSFVKGLYRDRGKHSLLWGRSHALHTKEFPLLARWSAVNQHLVLRRDKVSHTALQIKMFKDPAILHLHPTWLHPMEISSFHSAQRCVGLVHDRVSWWNPWLSKHEVQDNPDISELGKHQWHLQGRKTYPAETVFVFLLLPPLC